MVAALYGATVGFAYNNSVYKGAKFPEATAGTKTEAGKKLAGKKR